MVMTLLALPEFSVNIEKLYIFDTMAKNLRNQYKMNNKKNV